MVLLTLNKRTDKTRLSFYLNLLTCLWSHYAVRPSVRPPVFLECSHTPVILWTNSPILTKFLTRVMPMEDTQHC